MICWRCSVLSSARMPWAAARVGIWRSPSVSGLHRDATPERSAVGGWRARVRAAEVIAQRGRRPEAAARGDLLDRQIGPLEQALRLEHALAQQPLQRRRARLGPE